MRTTICRASKKVCFRHKRIKTIIFNEQCLQKAVFDGIVCVAKRILLLAWQIIVRIQNGRLSIISSTNKSEDKFGKHCKVSSNNKMPTISNLKTEEHIKLVSRLGNKLVDTFIGKECVIQKILQFCYLTRKSETQHLCII